MKNISFILTLFSVTKAYGIPPKTLQIDLGNDKCLSNDKGKAIACDKSNTWFSFDGASSTLCSKDKAKMCINSKAKLSTKQPAKFSREDSMLTIKSGKKSKCIASNGKKLTKLKTCDIKPMPTEIDSKGYLKVSAKECILGKKLGGQVKIGKCAKTDTWTMDKLGKLEHKKTKGCLEMNGEKVILAPCGKASSWKLGDSMRNEGAKKCLYRGSKKSKFLVQSCINYLKFNLPQVTTAKPATATYKPDYGAIEVSKNNLVGAITTTRNWTLEFSIKIKSKLTKPSSVLHFGNSQYDNHPEIILYPHANYIMFYIKTSACKNSLSYMTKTMTIYFAGNLDQYYNIKIESKEFNANQKTMNQAFIYVDGVKKTSSYFNVCDAYKANVYAGSQWFEPADACIKDLKYNGNAIKSDTTPTPKPTYKPDYGVIEISKNKLLGTITTERKWTLEFSIKYKAYATKVSSLLHFGNGRYDSHPEILVYPNSKYAVLYIKSSVCDHKTTSNIRVLSLYFPMTVDKYYNIKIESKEYNATVKNMNRVTASVDGIVKNSTYFNVCDAYKANVYAGSQWYEPADTCIKNLKYNGKAIGGGTIPQTTPKPTYKPDEDVIEISENKFVGNITTTRDFTLEFSIKIKEKQTVKTSVLHLGTGEFDYHPEIVLAPHSGYLMFYLKSSICKSKKAYGVRQMAFYFPSKVDQYYNIKLESKSYNNSETLNQVTVFVDGKKNKVSYFNQCAGHKANVYAGSQWYKPANGCIKDLKYNGEAIEGTTPYTTPKPVATTNAVTTEAVTKEAGTTKAPVTTPETGVKLSKNKHLGAITTTRDYTLEFAIKIISKPTKPTSVLHIGNGQYDRHPEVLLYPFTSSAVVYLKSSFCKNDKNISTQTRSMAFSFPTNLNEYYNIKIESKEYHENQKTINKVCVYVNGRQRTYSYLNVCDAYKANVYAASQWYEPANAFIKDIKYNGKAIPAGTASLITPPPAVTYKPETGAVGISKDQKSGSITTTRNYTLEFSIKILSKPTKNSSVLHIGNGQYDSHPEIVMIPHGSYAYFYLKSSACENDKTTGIRTMSFYFPNPKMAQYYKIKIVSKEYHANAKTINKVVVSIDDKEISTNYSNVCSGHKATVYTGSPWLPPAHAYIKDFKYNGAGVEVTGRSWYGYGYGHGYGW